MSSFPQNIGLGANPQVWLSSDHVLYNAMRPMGYAPWLTPVQAARLERIRQARLLFDGRHRELFLYEGRTQFEFPDIKVNGRSGKRFVPYNLCKLISLVNANLLFGNDPTISVDDEIQQAKLVDLITRTRFHELLSGLAVECSCDGEAYIEAVIENGQTYLKRMDAADIFPVGKIQPDGQYKSYVKYNAKNAGTDNAPDWRLLITTYETGRITRELKQLDSNGVITSKVLTLNQWPQENPDDEPLDEITETGIAMNTITFIPNLLVREIPVSDYDGIIEAQDSLNAAHTQVADVLAKHANPKLAVPKRMADAGGNIPANAELFFFDQKDEIPSYIVWQSEIAAAMANRKEIISSLLIQAEMSPILLGISDGAASKANAFKSIRLEATPALAKTSRKTIHMTGGITRMITVAALLDQTIAGNRYDQNPIGVDISDGLPTDDDMAAQNISVLRAAGVMSVRRALEELIGNNQAAIQKELDRLAEEAAATTPSIFTDMHGPTSAQPEGAVNAKEQPEGIAA